MIAAALLCLPAVAQDVSHEHTHPGLYIAGESFGVTVTVGVTGQDPVAVPAWVLTPAAFELDGTPLGERPDGTFLTLVAGQSVTTSFDLGPAIATRELQGRAFRLAFTPADAVPVEVLLLERAPRGIDFMTLPLEQLGDYDVVLETSRGLLWLEFWPDVAPNHVRNFLDLAYTGFFDDTEFHRVVPGFMIQGGGAKPGKPAPRRVAAELSDRRHVPGILSMARLGVDTKDEKGETIPAMDSATCEFFVMHAVYPSLDGKYTPFGELVTGLDVVELIVHSGNKSYSPRDPRSHKPPVRQVIRKAVVVKAPLHKPNSDEDE